MAFHVLLDSVSQEACNVPAVAHVVNGAIAVNRLRHITPQQQPNFLVPQLFWAGGVLQVARIVFT